MLLGKESHDMKHLTNLSSHCAFQESTPDPISSCHAKTKKEERDENPMAAAEKANKHNGFLAPLSLTRGIMRLYGLHLTSKNNAKLRKER